MAALVNNSSSEPEITAEVLKASNFDVKTLIGKGFSIKALRSVWFDADQFKEAGVSALDLRCAGFGVMELREGSYNAKEVSDAGFTNKQLMLGGYDAVDMKENLKLTAQQCRDAGYMAKELKKVGFMPAELKEAGYPATELATCCNPKEMFKAGYNKEVLKPLGFWKHDGEWQYYNQYWSCCHSLDSDSRFCIGLKKPNTVGSDLAC